MDLRSTSPERRLPRRRASARRGLGRRRPRRNHAHPALQSPRRRKGSPPPTTTYRRRVLGVPPPRALPLVTSMPGEVPVIELVLVSVAVIVCRPVVPNVIENVPTPAVNVMLEGSVAALSLLVIATVPI